MRFDDCSFLKKQVRKLLNIYNLLRLIDETDWIVNSSAVVCTVKPGRAAQLEKLLYMYIKKKLLNKDVLTTH